MGIRTNAEFYAELEIVEKNANNFFFWVHFLSNYFNGFEISVKFWVFWIYRKRNKKCLGVIE
jgi:hypothetical protein